VLYEKMEVGPPDVTARNFLPLRRPYFSN